VANVNQVPVLTSSLTQSGREGQTLRFTLAGDDVDGEYIGFGLRSALPEGARFDRAAGTFEWTPGFEQAGSTSCALPQST